MLAVEEEFYGKFCDCMKLPLRFALTSHYQIALHQCIHRSMFDIVVTVCFTWAAFLISTGNLAAMDTF